MCFTLVRNILGDFVVFFFLMQIKVILITDK